MPASTPAFATASRPMFRLAACVVALGCLLVPPADAQSNASMRQSEASLMASVEVPVAIVGALAQGSKFVVTSVATSGVAASGAAVAVTVSVVGLGASFVVHLSAEAVKSLAIATGKTLEVVVVSGGWLLMASGEALCFVADEIARPHIHSRQLSW
ncbi:MAG: hypothetical protein ABL934_07615 [Lysobacteraceae bacterium]